jgi:hypothetical protein
LKVRAQRSGLSSAPRACRARAELRLRHADLAGDLPYPLAARKPRAVEEANEVEEASARRHRVADREGERIARIAAEPRMGFAVPSAMFGQDFIPIVAAFSEGLGAGEAEGVVSAMPRRLILDHAQLERNSGACPSPRRRARRGSPRFLEAASSGRAAAKESRPARAHPRRGRAREPLAGCRGGRRRSNPAAPTRERRRLRGGALGPWHRPRGRA